MPGGPFFFAAHFASFTLMILVLASKDTLGERLLRGAGFTLVH
jgi:hypothetical protein